MSDPQKPCREFDAASQSGSNPPRDENAAPLPADRRAMFAQLLVAELRQRVAAGDTPSQEEYETSFPGFAEQIAQVFQGGTTLGGTSGVFDGRGLGAANPHTPFADPERATQLPATFGDYELLEEIARGGMGVVYKARQKSLNRVVALKMILAGALASEREVQRFRSEAEAAAKLDHPGIVPIYEVGRHAGHYFYSMAYVPGQSLAQLLSAGPLPPYRAAELMKQVATAVSYAHEQGVIHRDLKPANILLAEAGGRRLETGGRNQKSPADSSPSDLQPPASSLQPRITDFGLAKQVESDSGLTQSGQIVGTPSYMPPEQAAGNVAEIGPRADVYSLGATLYALVTARPPFQAASVGETLRQVQEQEPVPPRRLNPAIDKDLETICLKCLQKDPAQRYATAADFAADLGRFTQHIPILARPISRPTRLLRWCRRNPRLSTLTAALILALVSGSILSTYFAIEATENAEYFRQEKERADGETEKAKEALGKEQAALVETENSIRQYVETVKHDNLLNEPRFRPLLKSLLASALAHYERFVDENGETQDETTRKRLAEAFTELGTIRAMLGIPGSMEAHEQSLAVRELLVRDNPQSAEGQLLLAHGLTNVALTLFQDEEFDKSLVKYNEAMTIYSRLVQANPADEMYSRFPALTLDQIGGIYLRTDNLELAFAAYQKSLAIHEQLAAQNPGDELLQTNLANCLNLLGILHVQTGNLAEGLDAAKRSLAIADRLWQSNPTEMHTSAAAFSYSTVGNLYSQSGRLAEALESLKKGQFIYEGLRDIAPTNKAYLSASAANYATLGSLFHSARNFDDAILSYDEALEINESLARENPDDTQRKDSLALVHLGIASLHQSSGKMDEALAACKRALAIHEELASAAEDDSLRQSSLASTLGTLAQIHLQMGNAADALNASLRQTMIARELHRKIPDVIRYTALLATSLAVHANIQRMTGNREDALTTYQEQLSILEKLFDRDPENQACQATMATTLGELGDVQKQMNNPAGALKSHTQALDIFERLGASGANPALLGLGVPSNQVSIAALSMQSDPERAAKLLEQAIPLLDKTLAEEPKNPLALSCLSRAYSTRATLRGFRGEHADAIADWKSAIEFDNGESHWILALGLAGSHVMSGNHTDAVLHADKLSAEGVPSNVMFGVVAIYTMSMAAASADKSLDAAARHKILDDYGDKALALLKKAADDGYFHDPQNVRQFEENGLFAPLRLRDDFRELLGPTSGPKGSP